MSAQQQNPNIGIRMVKGFQKFSLANIRYTNPLLQKTKESSLYLQALDAQIRSKNADVINLYVIHGVPVLNLAGLASVRYTAEFLKMIDTNNLSCSLEGEFPFYAVKIDRSFIKDIPENEDDIKISKAIINLAHSLDKKVVAEGIETKEQLEYMKTLDCDFGQGYLFSKPVSSEEFDKLLRSMVIG